MPETFVTAPTSMGFAARARKPGSGSRTAPVVSESSANSNATATGRPEPPIVPKVWGPRSNHPGCVAAAQARRPAAAPARPEAHAQKCLRDGAGARLVPLADSDPAPDRAGATTGS